MERARHALRDERFKLWRSGPVAEVTQQLDGAIFTIASLKSADHAPVELFRSVYGGQLTQDRLCALVALSYSAQLRVLSETRSPLFAQRRPRARRVSEGFKKICMVGVHGWGEVVLSETMTVEERCQFPIKCLMCSSKARFHCSE